VRDGELHRRQRSRRQDRTGDDDAGRGLLVNDEVGADAEHCGLQQHTEHLRDGAQPAGDVRRALLARHVTRIRVAPSTGETIAHAHGVHGLGIAPACFREAVSRHRSGDGLFRRATRERLGEKRERDQEERPEHGDEADPRVEGKADGDVQGDPGQIEKGGRTGAGQEAADLIEIAQRLQAVALSSRLEGHPQKRVINAAVQGLVEGRPDAGKDPTSDEIQDALEGVQPTHDDREPDERRDAAARQHPVVDLEHVERAGQVQHADGPAQEPDAEKGETARREGGRKLCFTCTWSDHALHLSDAGAGSRVAAPVATVAQSTADMRVYRGHPPGPECWPSRRAWLTTSQ
jgi:hypothetical protein